MKNFKKKLLLPVLAVVIAVGGAFANQAETNENSLVVWGHYKTTLPCDTQIQCSTFGQFACEAPNGQLAKGMTGSNICQQPLFRIN